jgi:hypothetical protein
MKNNDVGGKAEAIFIGIAFDKGWEIAKPFHHANNFDYVIRMPGKIWQTVQVKSAYLDKRNNRSYWTTNLRRSLGQRYLSNAFDWLFTTDGKRFWLIPWEVIREHKSAIVVDSSKFDAYLV